MTCTPSCTASRTRRGDVTDDRANWWETWIERRGRRGRRLILRRRDGLRVKRTRADGRKVYLVRDVTICPGGEVVVSEWRVKSDWFF